jgi:hypothetical protein
MNHEQACGHCPKYIRKDLEGEMKCSIYTDTTWVNRVGGCAMLPERDMPVKMGRVGQQKQKHNDKSYGSKNNSKNKFRSVE